MNVLAYNFYHSGDLGDIIYSLPIIKKIGGGNLILGNNFNTGQDPDTQINQATVENLQPVLLQQPYIHSVEYCDDYSIPINYNLNEFRSKFVKWSLNKLDINEANKLKSTNLVKLHQNEYNIQGHLYLDKWLTYNKSIQYNKTPIVINRTPRYNNNLFPWQQIIETFRHKILFLGLEEEYHDFCRNYGEVDYIQTPEIITAYEIIAGSKLFIGNQSFPYSLAEGLKKPCIQETDTYMSNCMFFRKDSYITNTYTKLKYTNIEQFLIKYLIC